MVKNNNRKTKLDSIKNRSKVKVSGQGPKKQKAIKNDSFQAVTSITQNVIGRF